MTTKKAIKKVSKNNNKMYALYATDTEEVITHIYTASLDEAIEYFIKFLNDPSNEMEDYETDALIILVEESSCAIDQRPKFYISKGK